MTAETIRAGALLAALGLGIFYVASGFLAAFRSVGWTVLAMSACAAYALARSVQAPARNACMDAWFRYKGTPMAPVPAIRSALRRAFAWSMADSCWMAMDLVTCLTWGVPGVMASLFQLLFLAGFPAIKRYRPDLSSDPEQARAMDMLEGLLIAQACAAILARAWISA